jgi:hypothetical protein
MLRRTSKRSLAGLVRLFRDRFADASLSVGIGVQIVEVPRSIDHDDRRRLLISRSYPVQQSSEKLAARPWIEFGGQLASGGGKLRYDALVHVVSAKRESPSVSATAPSCADAAEPKDSRGSVGYSQHRENVVAGFKFWLTRTLRYHFSRPSTSTVRTVHKVRLQAGSAGDGREGVGVLSIADEVDGSREQYSAPVAGVWHSSRVCALLLAAFGLRVRRSSLACPPGVPIAWLATLRRALEPAGITRHLKKLDRGTCPGRILEIQ